MRRPPWTARLAWLPLLLLLALIALLYAVPTPVTLQPRWLLPALNLLIPSAAALVAAALATYSYLAGGAPAAALLGMGLLVFGLCSLLAGLPIPGGSFDSGIAIHNSGLLLAALCSLAAALRSNLPAGRRPGRPLRAWLLAGYSGAVLAVSLLYWAETSDLLPPFFEEGEGSTPLRQAVLGSAIIVLAAASGLLLAAGRRDRSAYLRWSALGLGLLAIGFWGVFGARSFGSLLAWAGRGAQYLGVVYLLAGGISAARESGSALAAPFEALRESEDRFRTLADNIAQLAWMADESGRIFWYNKRWLDYTGTTAEEMKGSGWKKVHHPDHADRVTEKLSRCFQSGEAWEDTFPLRGKDGRYRWYLSRAIPIRNEAGNVVRWFGTSTDVTEQREAEQALRVLNETLESRVAERTAVAEERARQLQALAVQMTEAEEWERRRIADLLHDDLQQVLASARMQLSVLQSALQGGEQAAALFKHVAWLIEEAVRKSRRLSHELSPAILHHSGLKPALEWLARQMGEQHGLEVTLETSPDWDDREAEPLKVFLFRSVQEMLLNTISHSQAHSAGIRLSRPQQAIELSVSDPGVGFDPQSVYAPGGKVSGLGLLSIRERARSIGGILEIDSAPGRGSRICLRVPARLQAESEAAGPQSAPAAPDHPPAQAARPDRAPVHRVLLVDDHRVLRQGLIALIRGKPELQVVGEASNGREALELARALRPDVIVMDVAMPRMDGIEATRRIKEELPGVRVIGLSMFEEAEVVERMRRAGAETVVAKADSTGSLLKAIYGLPQAG